MTDRPIIFSKLMVRALLARRKRQTRRILSRLGGRGAVSEFGESTTTGYDWHFRDRGARWHDVSNDRLLQMLPYAIGDRLWVRENCRALERESDAIDGVKFEADGAFIPIKNNADAADKWGYLFSYAQRRKPIGRGKTVPSIHMPRWASRLTLIVEGVNVERLQDINSLDAMAEGIVQTWGDFNGDPPAWALRPGEDGSHFYDNRTSAENFSLLWESINGPGAWDANPWVVAISFRVIKANIDAPEAAA